MKIVIDTISREQAISEAVQAVCETGYHVGTHDESSRLSRVNGVTIPAWNRNSTNVSVNINSTSCDVRDAPPTGDVFCILEASDLHVRRYTSSYHYGGSSRPRWGLRIVHSRGKPSSGLPADKAVVFDLQEVSSVPYAGEPKDEIFDMAWALSRASKKILVENRVLDQDFSFARWATAFEREIQLYKTELGTVRRLQKKVRDLEGTNLLRAWAEATIRACGIGEPDITGLKLAELLSTAESVASS